MLALSDHLHVYRAPGKSKHLEITLFKYGLGYFANLVFGTFVGYDRGIALSVYVTDHGYSVALLGHLRDLGGQDQ